MQVESKTKSACTILVTFQETNFVEHYLLIHEKSIETVENTLPKWDNLACIEDNLKNLQPFRRYNQAFQDKVFKIRVIDVFPIWMNWLHDLGIYGLVIILIQLILCVMRASYN